MRFLMIVTMCLGLLTACSPARVTIENNVTPQLLSIKVPLQRPGIVLIQGRYLTDGFSGDDPSSYVIVGADISGAGGLRLIPETWTDSFIAFSAPEGAGSGFVYVVVRGQRSNGLPASMP
jgi:hypothetical protein